MSIVRVGLSENKDAAAGYEAVFGKRETKATKKPAAPKSSKKPVAKKKAKAKK